MKNIIILIAAVVWMSCGTKTTDKEATPGSNDAVTLTPAQYAAVGITLGKIERKVMSTAIQVNGKLDVPPQNLVTISAPLGGFVKSTSLLQGTKVKKGDILVTLENHEYIQLQQDYLDNASKLEFLEAEYNRQTELAKENVNAQKVLQQSKSQFESTKAVVKGLEAKLAMINIVPASLKDGKIHSTINLYSPISGFVTTVNVTLGQYVSATEVMFRIVNLEHIHAELEVYEKDIRKILIGQKVDFRVTGEDQYRTASVYLIGKEISPDRTVRVHCHLEKEDPSLLPGMFLTANVETAAQEFDVVPTRSIQSFESTSIVFFVSGENQFKAVPVKTGTMAAEYTAIEFPEKTDRNIPIVVEGGFQLLGLLKNIQEDE